MSDRRDIRRELATVIFLKLLGEPQVWNQVWRDDNDPVAMSWKLADKFLHEEGAASRPNFGEMEG